MIKEELADISTIESPTERAITLMLYGMRRQLFLDGNKRTSMLAGNHVMITNGQELYLSLSNIKEILLAY